MDIESSDKRPHSSSEEESPQETRKPREDTVCTPTPKIFFPTYVAGAADTRNGEPFSTSEECIIESAGDKTEPIGFSVARFETDTLLKRKVVKVPQSSVLLVTQSRRLNLFFNRIP